MCNKNYNYFNTIEFANMFNSVLKISLFFVAEQFIATILCHNFEILYLIAFMNDE